MPNTFFQGRNILQVAPLR